MILLRRVLVAGALVLMLVSIPLVVVPSPVVDGLLDQKPTPDDVWVRLFGAAGVALGLVHVLILRKLDELWWWCWAFVIFDGLGALISLAHAGAGVPDGSAAWPWWVYGGGSVLFAALYLAGLARAGQEKPFA